MDLIFENFLKDWICVLKPNYKVQSFELEKNLKKLNTTLLSDKIMLNSDIPPILIRLIDDGINKP